MDLTGIHHLTAVTADVRENHRFYTQVLGMRLVKRSVNQDDVSAYHLFYADKVGSPGTDVTFFDWAMPRERRGTNSITCTSLRVNGAQALDWWTKHFESQAITADPVVERDGRLTLDFEDTEGQRLSLVDDGGAGEAGQPWEKSPVPPDFQVRGLGPITLNVPDLGPTNAVLKRVMNMRQVRSYPDPESPAQTVYVYEMGEGGAHAELHVAVRPDLSRAHLGAGGVHHVAFRTPTEEQYHAWFERLQSLGVQSSGEIDRYYFHSLYFREPNGILFEIATDGPGFAVDEDAATLGEKVVLPPFLEPRRAQIIANLKPIE
ncbi:putative ring-cleaving dioxygenase MhqA [Abditibacteriota bacterium]|nr:putative ring-cleaving dioxygenase MhqA [Abditibacteriota bacterium]